MESVTSEKDNTPRGDNSAVAPMSLKDYLEYVQMKARTSRIDSRTKKIAAQSAEIKHLKSTFKHWYEVGISPDGPCKRCSYPIGDSAIHKDSPFVPVSL